MENLMLVGGIPYSGKSYLCDAIKQRNPKYKILGIDSIHDKLEEEPEKFFESLQKFYPAILQQFGISTPSAGKRDLNKLKYAVITAVGKDGKTFWNQLFQQAVNSYIVSELSHIGGEIPVIESLLHDRVRRRMLFESLSEMAEIMGFNLGLDETKKMLVYLNLGLDVSLKRHSRNTQKREIVDERVIHLIHRTQEIPKNEEFPNLEVVVLQNESEVSAFVNSLSS
ncbi:hypothetical protein HYT53_01815 [Candidatus Woesearchaeota archaeon]|nr:hypothetical protein [Candidatus Woesearchaeota archaeon]